MRRSVRWLLIGICLTGSVGFKEPYLFTTAAIVLIMRPRPRQWLEDYVIPAALTGVACGILFLLAGWVRPLHGYLQYMLGTHVTLFGSPWRRALDVVKLIDELNEFLPLLGWLVVVAAVGALASQLQREPASLRPLVGARWVAAIYLTSFAVGLGGHYWQHHYVLAVPAYLAWFVELWPYSDHPAALRMPQVIALPLLLVLILGLPAYTAERLDSKLAPFASRSQQAQKSAKYIDAVLDRFGEKRWLFLGQWQMQAYAWTHHSPAGPMFSQMSAFMQTSAAFRKDVLIQLDEAHFVAEYSLVDLGAELQATVKARLEKDFSTTIPPCIQSLDQEGGLDYHYHFRKPIEKLCERR